MTCPTIIERRKGNYVLREFPAVVANVARVKRMRFEERVEVRRG